jgi:hypothetical protein
MSPDSPVELINAIGMKGVGEMRIAIAMLFVVNIAAFVWMRALPEPQRVAFYAVAEEIDAMPLQEKVGALTFQVETARLILPMYQRLQFAAKWVTGLLIVDAGVFFLLAVIMTARKQAASPSKGEPAEVCER